MIISREIKLVEPDTAFVYCNGGESGLGHPKIRLRFDNSNFVDCYYCGQRFAKPDYSETPIDK